jgi:hypothetical protein
MTASACELRYCVPPCDRQPTWSSNASCHQRSTVAARHAPNSMRHVASSGAAPATGRSVAAAACSRNAAALRMCVIRRMKQGRPHKAVARRQITRPYFRREGKSWVELRSSRGKQKVAQYERRTCHVPLSYDEAGTKAPAAGLPHSSCPGLAAS